jgi:AmmeMemoRadiSam system protein B
MVRRPAVAGAFYPGTKEEMDQHLEALWPEEEVKPRPAKAVVSPHAGWVYSGRVAARTIARVEVPGTVVILGPNHRGLGRPAAIMSQGSWLMPGGPVELDSEFGELLKEHSSVLEEDHLAHAQEHSLEVQVPFLTRINPGLRLVPICLARSDLGACRDIGQALAATIDQVGRPVLMLASTDMSHYEPVETARLKDRLAIDHILDLDPEGLYTTVSSQGITMCGVVPTVIALFAAQTLGAAGAELVKYATSGDVNKDFRQVVGYAGLIIN